MEDREDRDLLFGAFALQLGFVSRDQLMTSVKTWIEDTSKPLSRHLLDQGVLQDDTHKILETLVDKHLQLHGNDPERRWAALEASSDYRACLAELKSSRASERPALDVTSDCTPGAAGAAPAAQDVTIDSGFEVTDAGAASTIRLSGARELLGGRFRVLRPYAKGGLGKVSVALDEELQREVAFKELLEKRSTDATARARLLLEAEITGSLEHPGVVPVYGLGQYADGRPFYAMRLIHGETLRAAIHAYHTDPQEQSVPMSRSLRLRRLLSHFLATCNVIEYAHSRGIIHRDLKPDNVMLGKYGETLVVDWGLAKPVDRQESESAADTAAYRPQRVDDVAATQLGSVIGTPAYMSPEQARGQVNKLSAATDIYSLGATLYSVLTDQQPFDHESVLEIVKRVSKGEFAHPRAMNRAVPAALEAVCLKAMATRRKDRYVSAAAMGEDIEHWLADEPVTAHRESIWQRLGRWTRRHRAWTQAGAAALVVVALVLGAATLLVNRARRTAIDLADQNETLAQREQVAKREAVTRLGEARKAVDTWLTGMSDALQYYPGMQEARRRLLEKAVLQYQQFAQQPSDDPELKLERGRACLRLGDVHRLLNDTAAAQQAYRDAQELLSTMLDGPALSLEATVEWANSQNRLGLVAADVGDLAAAEAAYRAGTKRLQRTVTDADRNDASADALASLLTNWGALCLVRGDMGPAESHLQESQRLFTGLVARASQEPRHRESLASVQTILARLDMSVGRYPQAQAKWQAALAVLDDLVRQSPDQPTYLETRASTRLAAASLLRLMGQYEAELEAYRTIIADYEALQKALPDVPAYRENMALTHTDLGQALHELRRNVEAREALERAHPILSQLAVEYPLVPRYYEAQAACRDILSQVLLDLDQSGEAKARAESAVETYQRLANANPDVPQYRERLAVCISHLGQARHRLQETDARTSFDEAIRMLSALIEAHPEDPAYRSEKAHVLQHIGSLHFESEDPAQAEKAFAEAVGIWEALGEQDTPEYVYRLCTALLLCPLESCRQPLKGLEHAQQLVQRTPENATYVAMLGIAMYRSRQWEAALETLQRAAKMRAADDSQDWFFISMAQAQLQHPEEARASFERACRSMDQFAPGDDYLKRQRQEAQQLLKCGTGILPVRRHGKSAETGWKPIPRSSFNSGSGCDEYDSSSLCRNRTGLGGWLWAMAM